MFIFLKFLFFGFVNFIDINNNECNGADGLRMMYIVILSSSSSRNSSSSSRNSSNGNNNGGSNNNDKYIS